MAERPFKIFGSHERAALGSAIETALRDWAAAWLPQPVSLRIRSGPLAELQAQVAERPREGWAVHRADSGASVALAAGADDLRELSLVLCGVPAERGPAYRARSPLAEAIAPKALRELAGYLLGQRVVQETKARPADDDARGSASYAAAVAIEAASLTLLLDPTWTLERLKAGLPKPAPARLAGRRSAVDGERVALHAVAGWAELEIGLLQGLRVGNVIALDTRIDRPMALATASGGVLCAARLGAVAGGKAVSLIGRGNAHG
jgi:hypothetical protein